MKRLFLLVFSLGLFFQNGFSQGFNKARLDSFFNALEQHNKFMGSVAVSKGGNLIYSRSIGYRDVANKTKADKNTKYRIGSISKTFTAILILKAVEQHKLTLDETIFQFFPAIKNAKTITVSQLLHHRSGIHNFTSDPSYLSWNTEAKSEKEMVSIIANGGSDFEPGTQYQYSNSNYLLLTYILQKVFKKPYAELLKQYVTTPLNLRDTYLGGKVNHENDEAYSYVRRGNWKIQPETDISIPLGAGGIVSTPVDLVNFSNALFNGNLLEPESLKLMKTLKDGYGMGLIGIPFYKMKGYGHTGGIDGFSSMFIHLPEGDVSYALTSNGADFNDNDISIAVLSAVYNKPYQMPTFPHYSGGSENLDNYVGIYSSPQVPMKITITKQGNMLVGQATGQSSFPLEPTAKNTFGFSRAGIIMEFNPEDSTMILKQSGGKVKFTKE